MDFSVFGLTGYGYGLAAGFGVLLYLAAALLLRRKTRVDADTILLGTVLGIPIGLLLSRLFYCVTNIRYYTQTIAQPVRMLYVWEGGFSMMGMLAGLVLAALVTARIKKLPFRPLLDAAVLPAGILILVLRLAEGLTENLGVGRQVDAGAAAESLPFLFVTETMGTLELHRLAVYRYEAAFALLVFAVMLWVFLRSKRRKSGDLTMLFFALYGAGQVVLESMRDDGHMVLGFIRVQQVLAILCPLIVLAVLCHRYAKRKGAKDSVTAAWMALPFAAVILWMMISPINHMLDLSDKFPLGVGLLALIALYLAFFLRIKGASPRLILTWLIAIAAVAGSVMLEFSLDGSTSLLRDYTLLALCCVVLFICPCTLLRTLNRQEELPK